MLPSLGGEGLGWRAGWGFRRVDIRASLHYQRGIHYCVACSDGEGLCGAAAGGGRNGRVSEGEANIEWECRVETERFVDDLLKVFHLLQVVWCGKFVGACC